MLKVMYFCFVLFLYEQFSGILFLSFVLDIETYRGKPMELIYKSRGEQAGRSCAKLRAQLLAQLKTLGPT